jgi:alpha-mannosidase
MSAWVIGPFKRREDLLQGGEMTKVHGGPYIQTYRWTRRLNESTLTLDVTLSQGVPRVDFQLRVDWREVGSREAGIPHLKVRFPMQISNPIAKYEIPFGSIQRDLFNGEEVPAQRWVDLSEGDGQGMTLVNTSKYGFNVEGATLNMTLLRASIDPDPLPDLGDHVIDYALVPHGQAWAEGQMMRAGEARNVPLVVTSADFHEGDLPPVHPLVSLSPDNVRLAALKKAQAGDGLILRLVEVEGKPGEAQIRFAPSLLDDVESVVEVDTLERPLEVNVAHLEEGVVHVPVEEFGITTVLVKLAA